MYKSEMSSLTLELNFSHSSGHPPLGGTVGATVVLAGGDPIRLQIDLNSNPQL